MVFDLLTSIFAGLAIILSIIGIISSRNSNRLSKKAIEISKTSTDFQTRPWIDIKISKFKDTDRYYEIVKENNSIYWKIKITLENIGSSPAVNIRYPNSIHLQDSVEKDESHFILLENIILGHGQKYQYDFSLGGEIKPGENIDKLLENYVKNDRGLIISFIVYYNGLFDKEIEYKSKSIFSISAKSVSMLSGSEMK